MRFLLIFLILLNGLYAGWQYLDPVKSTSQIPPLPANLQTLELLDEQRTVEGAPAESVDSPPGDEEQAKGADESARLAQNESGCYTLGPFKDKNILQQVKESLAEHASQIAERKLKQSEKHRYWVYIPALPGRKQARAMAKQLREHKIKDFYIVLSGENKNSISLGHFREPGHANRRLETMDKLGLKAEIKVIYRDYDIYWLDYRLDEKAVQDGFSTDEYLGEGVSRLARGCEGG